MTEIVAPNAPAIEGLHFRTHKGHADIPAMTEVMIAAVIEAPPPSAGIVIRAVTRDELRSVWDGMSEAFRAHLGAFESSEAALDGWVGSPRMEPATLMVAFDGDAVAAGVQKSLLPAEA